LGALATWSAVEVGSYRVADLARRNPVRTALMLEREAEAHARGHSFRIDRRWVRYSAISPVLRRAVLIAEDDAFYSHGGLDWNEIKASAQTNLERGRIVRGGSTITQQLAKNLFLGDRRTITRKLEEAFLAIRLERTLTKRRIFELYLNLIEWGDGIFGVEAAARRYFGVPASTLDERQALLLAAVIINPRRYSALRPSPRVERRVRIIASRMRRRGYLTEAQYLAATGQPPPEVATPDSLGTTSTAPATASDSSLALSPDSMAAPVDSDSAAAAPADSVHSR
jgi:monofunctional biosynthetic peptidoglycan transglycosylase